LLPTIAETIKKHGLRQKKSLGQHFLHHPELIEKIVRAAGNLDGKTVMEVGPGPGGLTRALLATKAARIIAIEKDSACIAALNELAAIDARLEIKEADALEITPPDGVTIVANLPYNVGTLMLLNWLDNIENISSMTLMFQKEVVDRLLAKPREEAYGRLSVIAQFHCRIEKRFDIPPSAFLPPPKVVSTVVSLFPRPDKPADISPRILGIITKAAFGQRRKMLRSSLKSLGVPVENLLADAGIDGSRRAEELSLNEFCALARHYSSFIT
jgi:16S rRNA (adenine1518-N6/adenine1519-N6)-dimethyltransferase